MTFWSISCSASKASTTKSVQGIKLSPKKSERPRGTGSQRFAWPLLLEGGTPPLLPSLAAPLQSQASGKAFCDKADQAGMTLRRKRGLRAGGELWAPRGLPDHVPTRAPSPKLPTREWRSDPFVVGGFSFSFQSLVYGNKGFIIPEILS